MTTPLPPEREGSTRHRRAGEGMSASDKSYDLTPTQRSRALRNNPTPAERKLWAALGSRRLAGVRFNRQVVIRPYICDLVARSQKLVIELDGGQHGEAVAYDKRRTDFLMAKGYRVLRFCNNDVMNNIDGVVSKIEEALGLSPPARAGGKEARSAEGEGLSSSDRTVPPPLASRVDPSRSGGRG